MTPESETTPSARTYRIKSATAAILAAQPAVVIPILEVVPGLTGGWQTGSIIVSALSAVGGIVWFSWRGRKVEDLLSENAELTRKLAAVPPEKLLGGVAKSLFKRGAWRISIYQKVPGSGEDFSGTLNRLAVASSDAGFSHSSPKELLIRSRTQFSRVFSTNLADPTYRFPDGSGPFVLSGADDMAEGSEEWISAYETQWAKWRNPILGTQPSGISHDFRPHQYAWYAAQHPESSEVFVVLAESTDFEGIRMEVLEESLTSAWMLFVADLANVRR